MKSMDFHQRTSINSLQIIRMKPYLSIEKNPYIFSEANKCLSFSSDKHGFSLKEK